MMDILHPDGWKRPKGYSHAVRAKGEMIFVAGQIGWDADEKLVGDDMASQTQKALANIVAILDGAGAGRADITRLTWYVTDMAEYHETAKEIGAAYRSVMGNHYPAMSLVEVKRLVESEAKVEIEATAVLSV